METEVPGKKLPLSALIVGYNEAHLLRHSLPSLSFCDEVLYFDLGSTDGSIDIARENEVTVLPHARVNAVEWIHAEHARDTRHEWILLTDPDEVIDPVLVKEVGGLFTNNTPNSKIAAVYAPIYYYFKKRKLKGTAWGGENYRMLLAHNQRVTFSPVVHAGRTIKDGYQHLTIKSNGQNGIHHYWMDSYRKLFEKHKRYLKHEGEARFTSGLRVSLKELILAPLKQFRISYLLKQGYKDGLTGLFLSLFWAWYQFSAQYRLYRFQKQNDSA